MILACKGAGSPDLRENKLKSIMIPIPDNNDLSSIDKFMEKSVDLLAQKADLQKELNKVDKDLKNSLKEIITGSRKNKLVDS